MELVHLPTVRTTAGKAKGVCRATLFGPQPGRMQQSFAKMANGLVREKDCCSAASLMNTLSDELAAGAVSSSEIYTRSGLVHRHGVGVTRGDLHIGLCIATRGWLKAMLQQAIVRAICYQLLS